MKNKVIKSLVVILSLYVTNVFALPLESIEVVTVGDPGNKADTTSYGAVPYIYKIGKYDVTVKQYTTFLNAKAKLSSDPVTALIWNKDMSDPKHKEKTGVLITRSGAGTPASPFIYTVDNTSPWGVQSGQRPICWVSWFDAARFANWMNNGADDNASTESGAYDLSGYKNKGIVGKSVGAKWWIPSENEWYKAAYYSPKYKNVGGYYNYPTQNDTVPRMGPPPGLPNSANFNDYYKTKGNVLTPVGAYTSSPSYYGTFDQGGLLWQWTDGEYPPNRIVRGGSFSYGLTPLSKTIRRDYEAGFYEDDDTGFRLACDPQSC